MDPAGVPSLTFNNGYKMPIIGLGTWKSKPGEVTQAVMEAIDAGYRHFDCAYIYGNETEVGEGLRIKMDAGVVKREDLFVTSKLWNTFHRPDLVEPALKESLQKLGLTYLDLYLIHWPFAFQEGGDLLPPGPDGAIMLSDVDYLDTWSVLERCVDRGLVRSLGLANFNSQQVDRVLRVARVKPANLQIECNPYLLQKELVQFCKDRGIVVTGYSPLGSPDSPYFVSGTPRVLDDPVLKQIAARHGKSVAQVALRWLVQRGVAVIPKSASAVRIRQNMAVFDFQLSEEEMSSVDGLDKHLRICHRDHARNHRHYPF
ncbi:1,5-anhydro-D-fructose reductase-like [Periplaneta americana]|uniref:1,5-anhydro-D-fructose reductase-like n=1 Tax=Periplaneta americana TaxID=6978 RepID=UPI0037E70045